MDDLRKIMVAMSGGVDSSAAALLMQQQGYTVCGATLRLFSNEDIGLSRTRTCCSLDDVEDARAVADRLGIRHYVFNFGEAFQQNVIRRFADGYAAGLTPNPCIDCNRFIKFSLLLERALLLEQDGMATGHYAQVDYDEQRGRWLLKKAVDVTKDQTYVLYAMTQEELSRTRFPLGGMTKVQVRDMAEQNGLVNARKPDSQDICFVKDGDYAGFLEQTMGVHCPPGEFVDTDGQVLGRHLGLHHYTVGQRKGLGVAAGRPLYVVRKDTTHNQVVLGDEPALFSDRLTATDCNWISVASLTAPMRVTAKARYSQKEQPATISPNDDGTVTVIFDRPQRALTAGQAVVFYDGELVVGGGTIHIKEENS